MPIGRDIVLACSECGHEEAGPEYRLLMLKVRMYNHMNQAHPSLVERFKEVVEEHPAPTR